MLKEAQVVNTVNQASIDKILNFIENRYKKGDYIYPRVLHKTLKIDLKLIYAVLEQAVCVGLMEQYLQLYCYHCQKSAGKQYKYIVDVPARANCSNCGKEVEQPIKYAVVIYKVV